MGSGKARKKHAKIRLRECTISICILEHKREFELLKHLNFFPYYKPLLETGSKKTTIRLGINNKFKENDLVTITVGWSESNCDPLCGARILSVTHKRIKNLSEEDLEGESPDCSQKEAIQYVLSSIYRKTVSREDYVTIIKWELTKGG